MKGKIFKIKNMEDELVLPITTTEAVYSEDGKTLNDEIDDINSSLDNKMNIVDGVLWVNEDLHSGSKIFSNVNVNLNHKTLNLERIELNNATLKNGNILVPNEKLITKGKIKLSNITINSPTYISLSIWADDVIIENCDFTNVAFHFSQSKKIKILNNRFDVTVDNSPSLVGSKEFCHITNSSFNLENCIIQGNCFKNSQNDCIDIFPTGHRTLISGNTFINCRKALEIKSHHRLEDHPDGRTIEAVKGCVVENNFFCNIPENGVCIRHYATDDINGTDFSLQPNVIYSNNIFSNDLGVTEYKAFHLTNVKNVQIIGSRTTNDIDNNNGNFVYLEKSHVIISDCVSYLKNFVSITSADALLSMANITNCIGLRLLGIKKYRVSNSEFTRLYPCDDGVYIIDNTSFAENLTFKNNVLIATNCIFLNVYNGISTELPLDNTYVCFTNCISQNAIPTESDYCKISNFKKMPTIKI